MGRERGKEVGVQWTWHYQQHRTVLARWFGGALAAGCWLLAAGCAPLGSLVRFRTSPPPPPTHTHTHPGEARAQDPRRLEPRAREVWLHCSCSCMRVCAGA